jgi:hypothetical protein
MEEKITTKGWLIRLLIPVVTILTATICFRSGIQVENLPHLQEKHLFMHVLYAINLFTLGGANFGAPYGQPQWAGSILYFLYFFAPAISLSALIEHIFVNAKIYLRSVIFMGNHNIIIGAGKTSHHLPEILHRLLRHKYFRIKFGLNVPIIVVDHEIKKNKHIFKKSHLLNYNADDADLIGNLNLRSARYIFINTDNEWVNIGLFFRLEKTIAERRRKPIVIIRIHSEDLMNELRKKYAHAKHVHFYNVHIEAVKSLWEESKLTHNIFLHDWMNKLEKQMPKK